MNLPLFFRKKKRILLAAVPLVVLFLAVFLQQEDASPSAAVSSELGVATLSPSGESGGAIVPASCASATSCFQMIGSTSYNKCHGGADEYAPCVQCNACGACANGQSQCNGACSVGAPALPGGFGGACTSAPNTCGMTNSGTISCSGCTAGTPSDLLCLPTVNFSINGSTGPVTVLKGDSEVFNWSTTRADSCIASSNDQWSGVKPTSGTATQSAVVTSDFSLSCTGVNGTTTKTIHVTVTCTPVTGAWGTCDCDTETQTRTNINAACLPWTETQDCPAVEKNKCRDFNWKEVAP